MEPSRLVEVKVGIFVVLATVIALAFIMILGGERVFFQRTDIVHIKVDESSGLGAGSVVTLAGLPCGNVSQISFDTDSEKLLVDLKIDRRCMPRITQGSTAAIHTQGALGDKYVAIHPGNHSSAPIKAGDIIEVENGADFLSALGRSGNQLEKAFQILDSVEKFMSVVNDRGLAQNLADSAKNLKNTTSNFNELLVSISGSSPKENKLKKSMDHIANILEKVDTGQGTLGSLINDPTVHEDLKSVLGGAKRNKLLKYLIRSTIQKGEEEDASKSGK